MRKECPNTGPRMRRRTLLKGGGVALLLPQMESLGEVVTESPKRLLTIVNHLSFYQPSLIPEDDGEIVRAPELLQELSDHFDSLKVFSGFDNPGVENGLGHTPCVGVLSGYFNTLERKNRISIDQAAAALIGEATRFPSLVFQAGENLNFSQISWDRNGLPVQQHDSPQRIFNLLFQVNENEAEQKRILAEDRSILDVVFRQGRSMEKDLNSRDRAKMDEYLTSVREVEQTVRRQALWADRARPTVDYAVEGFDRNSVDSYVDVMLDLAVLALQTDSTRAVTLQIPFWDGFQESSISGNYHDMSHHGQDPEKIRKLLIVEHAILARISRTLSDMKERTVGHESLFDQTTTLVTASMGSANAHTFNDLPALVFNSRLKTPGHTRLAHRPMCDLYLGLLRHFGAQQDTFGESESSVDLLA